MNGSSRTSKHSPDKLGLGAARPAAGPHNNSGSSGRSRRKRSCPNGPCRGRAPRTSLQDRTPSGIAPGEFSAGRNRWGREGLQWVPHSPFIRLVAPSPAGRRAEKSAGDMHRARTPNTPGSTPLVIGRLRGTRGRRWVQSDTPRRAGGLMSGAASKAVDHFT